jgi:hypothetical protein
MELPEAVRNCVEENKIGYISVNTPSGRISTNAVSYYFDDNYVYFLTPREALRHKFIEKNPEVTFMVDNGELMEKSAGIMIQGKAASFHPAKLPLAPKSILPKFLKYIAKYPEGIPFYALGTLGLNQLPDERKIYKYNFIRVNPGKIFYWDGYVVGRLSGKTGEEVKDDPVQMAKLALKGDFDIADEETKGFDVIDLMSLSQSIMKTALALAKLQEATPEEISRETNQTLSTSKANLDSLARIGYAINPEGEKKYILEA